MFQPLEAIIRLRLGYLGGEFLFRWLIVYVGITGGSRSRSSNDPYLHH